MAKNSSLFKTMAIVITTSALTLSVATAAVIYHAYDVQHNQSQLPNGGAEEKEVRDVASIDKTGSYGLIDEYTIVYTDGSSSTFIVANADSDNPGINAFPSSDGYTPEVKVDGQGNFIVDGVNTGILLDRSPVHDVRSIVSIEKTETNGLIDTYTITYTDDSTSTFLVVNGANGEQGIQGLPGANGVSPTVSINDQGYWVINGEATNFKAVGENGASLSTGHGIPDANQGKVGDTYLDVDSGNLYTKTDAGWGQPIGNNQGASVLVNNGVPGAAQGKVGDTYIDASTGNIYVKGENGWGEPIGNNQGSSFLTGQGEPNADQGKQGDTYMDVTNGKIYTKGDNGWSASIGSMMGPQGPQGPQGPAGTGISVGHGVPNANQGQVGDSYIDVDTGNIYTKDANGWGQPIGNNQGASVLVNNGAPTNEQGKVGDTYIDASTGNVYVKNETGWGEPIGNNQGASFLSGNGEPAADAGKVGDTYMNTSTGEIYQKTDTGWISSGNSIMGPQGPIGISLHTGTGAPSADLGVNQDSYIDTQSWNYYVKENGAWVLKGNIHGANGAAGTTPHIGDNGNWWIGETDTGVNANGNPGTSVVTGHGNPNGDNSDPNNPIAAQGGNVGDTYIDLDSGAVYVKDENGWQVDTSGATGIQGTTPHIGDNGNWWIGEQDTGVAAQGQNGQAGASVLTGNSEPTQGLGSNNDSYINTSTWDFYVKENGAWVLKGNIQGAQGIQGQSISVTSCIKTGENGLVDTYTITFSNGDTATFDVINGAAGAAGANGADGHSPVISIDNTSGNWMLDGNDTGVHAQGADGAQGATGNGISNIVVTASTADETSYRIIFTDGSSFDYTVANGVNGQDGADGTCMRSGDVDPAANLGNDGDSYINTTSWDYYVKENGAWVLVGNIKGIQGVNGNDGRSVTSIAKTGTEGLVDTYTITYSDSTTYTFTVTNGQNGTNGNTVMVGIGAPTDATGGVNGDSYIDSNTWNYYKKVAGNWELQGNIKGDAGEDGVSITSIAKTNTEGLVDTYTITYSNSTTSTFTVTNGQDGNTVITGNAAPTDQGVNGDSYINLSTWDFYVKENGAWVFKGNIKASSLLTGNGVPAAGNGKVGDSYLDVDTGNVYQKTDTGWGDPIGNIEGANFLTGTGAPGAGLGKEGDSYLDVASGYIYQKSDTGWGDPIGNVKGSNFLTGNGDPANDLGKVGDSYLDIVTGKIYTKTDTGWGTEIGNIHQFFDVEFNLNGGTSSAIDTQNIQEGRKVEVPPTDPTQDGWIFQGWFTDPDGGSRWDFDKDVVSSNITLYAHWAKFKVVNGILTECTATGDVTIPEYFDGQLVTGIADNVFENNTSITSVTLPYTLTNIGNSAFEGCTGLTSIIIPHNVKTIGNDAFKGCSSMAYIYFESVNSNVVTPLRAPGQQNGGLESIGDGAFAGCTSLRALVIPNSVTHIGQGIYTGIKGWTVIGNVREIVPEATGTITLAPSAPADPNLGDLWIDSNTGYFDIRTMYNGHETWYSEGGNLEYLIYATTSAGNPGDANGFALNAYYLDTVSGDILVNCTSSLESLSIPFVGESENSNQYLGYIFGAASSDENGAYVPGTLKVVSITGDSAIADAAMKDCKFVQTISIEGNPSSIGLGAFEKCISLKYIKVPYVGHEQGNGTYSYGSGDPTVNTLSSLYVDQTSGKLWVKEGNDWNLAMTLPRFGEGDPYKNNVEILNNDDIYLDYTTGYFYHATDHESDWSFYTSVFAFSATSFGYIFGATNSYGNYNYVPRSLETVALTGANGINKDTIYNSSFFGCYVEKIILPENLKIIESGAFEGTSIESIVIPNSVVLVGHGAFKDCNDLATVSLSTSMTSIESSTFERCYALTYIYIPSNIKNIKDCAFKDCDGYRDGLTAVYLSEGLESIGYRAFYDCNKLTNIIIPNSVKSISLGAFESCDGLESITLPFVGTDCKTFNGYSYGNGAPLASNQNSVYVDESNYDFYTNNDGDWVLSGNLATTLPSFLFGNGAPSGSASNNQGYLDYATFEYYQYRTSSSSWIARGNVLAYFYQNYHFFAAIFGAQESTQYNRVPSSLKSVVLTSGNGDNRDIIPENAFYGCNKITSITLPNGVKTIGDDAFRGCTSLVSIALPSNLNSIGARAFANSGLVSVVVPGSVASIGDNAFNSCTSLTAFVLETGVEKTIGDRIILGCTSLKTAVINGPITSFGSDVLDGDNALEYVSLGYGITTLEQDLFYRRANLKVVVLPESLITIGDAAFQGCTSLVSVNIPFGVTTLGRQVFYGDTALESIILPNSVTSIGYYCFAQDTALKYVTISEGLVEISAQAFDGCSAIQAIYIPHGVEVIGSRAFQNCSSLKYVALSDGLRTIHDFAFNGCYEIESIVIPNTVQYMGKGIFAASFGWQLKSNFFYDYDFYCSAVSVGDALPASANDMDMFINKNTGEVYFYNAYYDVWDMVGVFEECIGILSGSSDPTDATSHPLNSLYLNTTTGDVFVNCKNKLRSITLPFAGYTPSDNVIFEVIGGEVTGEKPDNLLGENYQLFVDTTHNNIWVKVDGEWLSGEVLARYYDRQPGTIAVGNGDPTSNSQPFTTDFYVDLDAYGCFYEKDAGNTAWHEVGYVTDAFLKFGYIFISPDGTYSLDEFNYIVPRTLTTVTLSAGNFLQYGESFEKCQYIEIVNLPDTLMLLGDRYFADCSRLRYIILPASLYRTYDSVFENCTSLKYVSFKDFSDFCSFGAATFKNCTSLESIIIPRPVFRIDDQTFYNCESLKYVVFEDHRIESLSVGEEAFAECNALESMVFPDTLGSFGDGVFTNCTSLKYVSFGNNPELHGSTNRFSGVFEGCNSLETIQIPFFTFYHNHDGHLIYNSYSNPTPSDGNDGDYWINKNTSQEFYKRNGKWEYAFANELGNWIYSTVADNYPTSPQEGDVYYESTTSGPKCYIYDGTDWVSYDHKYFSLYRLGQYFGFDNNDSLPESLQTIIISNSKGYNLTGYFAGATHIKNVILPDGLDVLSADAFNGCAALETVSIPNSVTIIGNNVFEGCTSLKNFNIPTELKQIGNYAFKNCDTYTTLVIPDTITSIGLGAFQGWDHLENIVLPFTGCDYESADPSDPTHFGHIFGAVDYNSNNTYVPSRLKNVVVTKGTYISYSGMYILSSNTFAGCSHIKSISVPDSVSVILEYAFKDCSSLTNVTFGDNPTVELFSNYVFSGCSSLETFVVPKSVQAFGIYTFENCTSLKYVVFADGSVFTGLNEGAFAGCSNLTAISLPDTTEFIGPYAFKNCTSLETVVIPSSVTDIYEAIFIGCTSLKTVSVPYLPFTPVYQDNTENRDPVDSDDFLDDNWIWVNTDTGDVWYRVGGDWYKSFNIKNDPSNTIKVTDSYSSAPSNPNEGDIWVCSGPYNSELLYSRYTSGNWTEPIRLNIRFLGSLFEEYVSDNSDVPDSLKTVIISNGEHANYTFSFAECSSLETVILPDDTQYIGCSAFEMCENLKNVNIPDSIIEIGNYAFSCCGLLKYVTLPYYILRIGDGAFEQCKSLIDADMSSCFDLFSIGEAAFADCSSLLRVTLPTELRTIGASAFSSCDKIQDVYIPYDVERVGEYAFENCTSLRKVVLYPNTTYTVIEESTFEGCINLREVYFLYNSSIEEIGRRAFADCINLTCICVSGNYDFEATVNLPTSLTTIGEQAFINCKGISAVVIPENVTEIGDKAFSCCTSLTYFMFNNRTASQPLTIGEQAFMDCAALRSIVIPETTTSIGRSAFNHCYSLESMTAPALYEYAFYEYLDSYNSFNAINEWSSLKYVVLTGNDIVTSDGYDGAFEGFASLVSIEFRGTLRNNTIDAHAFTGCTNLKSVIVPDTMEYIEGEAFKNCSSLESFNVPASALFIGNNSFEGCSSLKYVYFAPSNGALSIGERVFKNCSSLESIAFPDTYSSLDLSEAIFEGCTSLKALTLYDMDDFNCKPENPRVSDEDPIGTGYANYYASWLNYTTGDVFYVLNGQWELAFNIKPYSTSTILFGPNQSALDAANDGDVWLPSATSYTYKIKVNGSWSESYSIEHSSLGYLFDVSCENSCVPESLKTVAIGKHTNETYSYTFAGCEYLETVALPESVIIGNNAFEGCLELKVAKMPYSPSSYLILVGDYAFYECMKFEDFDFGGEIAMIGQYAFSNTALKYMYFDVHKIGEGAFDACFNLQNVVFNDSLLTEIGENAFSNCKSLVTVAFGVPGGYPTPSPAAGCTIGDSAFQGCRSLVDINFGRATITSVGMHAFSMCVSLPYIEFNNGLSTIGQSAFDSCYSLTAIKLPVSLTSIADYAFNKCVSLREVMYVGTDVQWDNVTIGSYGNGYFTAATKTFNA